MKTKQLVVVFFFAGAVRLCAQLPEETVVFRDDPLTWKVATVQIAWEFDKSTDIAEVRKFNDATDVTLATLDGYRGYVDAGGEGSPPVPRNPFLSLGLLQVQAEQGLLDHRYIYLSEYQRESLIRCLKVFEALPKTIRFSRLQLSLKVTVFNNTEADIILSGCGDLPLFYSEKPVVTAKLKEPLNGLVLHPKNASGVDLVFWSDLDTVQAATLMAAVANELNINLVHAQMKAMQNNKDLRLAMDMNNRRTYKFAINYGEDALIEWRVKKRAGVGGLELTVADILEKINAKGLRDDQGKPLLKIKDGRCIGVGTSPVVNKEFLLIASHGEGKIFFLWDWPLDTLIQGDVTLYLLCPQTRKFGDGLHQDIAQGMIGYENHSHDPFAQVMLGRYYQFMGGVHKDAKEAVKWYQKAVDQGNGFGMCHLSACCLNGVGVEKDRNAAMNWLRRSADKGDTDAQYQLAYCYEMGSIIEEDSREAVKWYRKASELGELRSQYRLGRCYGKAVGVTKDDQEAVKWYRLAAEQGHGEAENSFGYYLQNGIGVVKDERAAVDLFRKSAARGFVTGMFNLAKCYEKGCGIEKNEREAVRWYIRAAKRGEPFAMNALGRCYWKGIGLDRDDHEAVKWWRQAADIGDATGQNNLGYSYKNGIGVEKDGSEAVKWLRLAIENGNDMANKSLGLCYLEGLGVEKNEAEGVRLLRKAVELGITSAQDELKKIGK